MDAVVRPTASTDNYEAAYSLDDMQILRRGSEADIREVWVSTSSDLNARLKNATGKRLILQLEQHESTSSDDGLPRFQVSDLIYADAAGAAELAAEVARQNALLAGWKPSASPEMVRRVSELVESLLDETRGCDTGNPEPTKDEHQFTYQELMSLGPEYVPAIVQLMDDRRVLACPVISDRIIATTGLFHPYRADYRDVELVVDALTDTSM